MTADTSWTPPAAGPCEGYTWTLERLVRCEKTAGHRGLHIAHDADRWGGTLQWSERRSLAHDGQ